MRGKYLFCMYKEAALNNSVVSHHEHTYLVTLKFFPVSSIVQFVIFKHSSVYSPSYTFVGLCPVRYHRSDFMPVLCRTTYFILSIGLEVHIILMCLNRAPHPTNKGGLKPLVCMNLHEHQLISRH